MLDRGTPLYAKLDELFPSTGLLSLEESSIGNFGTLVVSLILISRAPYLSSYSERIFFCLDRSYFFTAPSYLNLCIILCTIKWILPLTILLISHRELPLQYKYTMIYRREISVSFLSEVVVKLVQNNKRKSKQIMLCALQGGVTVPL